jgi:Na+(H+)/acetate symporter ActP
VDISLSSWLVILLALLAANLPFFSERVFGILAWRAARKPFWLRLVELFLLYFAVGALAFFIEARLGNRFHQGWEFYAVTGCLFLVLAYPGFVLRYLRRRHDQS